MAFVQVKTVQGNEMLIHTAHVCRIVRDRDVNYVTLTTGEAFRFNDAETKKITDAVGVL